MSAPHDRDCRRVIACPVQQLTALYDAWPDQMAAPNSGQPKRHGGEATGNAAKKSARR